MPLLTKRIVLSAVEYPNTSDPFGAGTGGNVQPPWSEAPSGNLPGDRRALASSGPFVMTPGLFIGVDMAFGYARASSGGPIGSVNALQIHTDSIRDFVFGTDLYAGDVAGGCEAIMPVGVSLKESTTEVNVYPVPASNQISVTMSSTQGRTPIEIHDLTGKLVLSRTMFGTFTRLSVADLEAEVYLLHVETDRGTEVVRFVKE